MLSSSVLTAIKTCIYFFFNPQKTFVHSWLDSAGFHFRVHSAPASTNKVWRTERSQAALHELHSLTWIRKMLTGLSKKTDLKQQQWDMSPVPIPSGGAVRSIYNWEMMRTRASSVKLFLLTMPNRYNQSSLEDIQRHTVTASTNPMLRLPRYSANILDISIKSVWLNNSSEFHLSADAFRF